MPDNSSGNAAHKISQHCAGIDDETCLTVYVPAHPKIFDGVEVRDLFKPASSSIPNLLLHGPGFMSDSTVMLREG